MQGSNKLLRIKNLGVSQIKRISKNSINETKQSEAQKAQKCKAKIGNLIIQKEIKRQSRNQEIKRLFSQIHKVKNNSN